MSTVPNRPRTSKHAASDSTVTVVTVSEHQHEVRCSHCPRVEIWEHRKHAEQNAAVHVCAVEPSEFRRELDALRSEIAEIAEMHRSIANEVRTRRLVVVDEHDVERIFTTVRETGSAITAQNGDGCARLSASSVNSSAALELCTEDDAGVELQSFLDDDGATIRSIERFRAS